jgi:hypothetical protein
LPSNGTPCNKNISYINDNEAEGENAFPAQDLELYSKKCTEVLYIK